MPLGLTSCRLNVLCNAAGQPVGIMGANGNEYLFGTSANGPAVAAQAMHNPAAVAITGGSVAGVALSATSVRSTSRLSALTDGSGTPGNVTQNVERGRAAFAASSSSVVVTNSQVAANSSVFVSLGGADATLTGVRASCAAGSFTVTGNAAATGITPFDYIVVQN